MAERIFKWNFFLISRQVLHTRLPKQMITLRKKGGELLFFAYSVLDCAGYKHPEKVPIPESMQIRIEEAHGLLLDEAGARHFGQRNPRFIRWLDGYVSHCADYDAESNVPIPDKTCPI